MMEDNTQWLESIKSNLYTQWLDSISQLKMEKGGCFRIANLAQKAGLQGKKVTAEVLARALAELFVTPF